MTEPVRIQLSRRKGFNLQGRSKRINGLPAVSVARPGPYGNPFIVGETTSHGWLAKIFDGKVMTAEHAVALFRRALLAELLSSDKSVDVLMKLRGKNLACWCKPGEPCHADVLLELANR
jgi:hypothetical protein